MMTIDEIAETFKVSPQSAYGLMQFLKEIGQVEVTEAPSQGKRGRRPKLYKLATMAELYLWNLLNPQLRVDPIKAA
jgi:predicted ArsR family transcriptional regulator